MNECTGVAALRRRIVRKSHDLNLTPADVQNVDRAVVEALARGAPATIAVVDHVSDVLAVFALNVAPATSPSDRAAGAALDVIVDNLGLSRTIPASSSDRIAHRLRCCLAI